MQKEWHRNVLKYFKKMNDTAPHHEKIEIFKESTNDVLFEECTNPLSAVAQNPGWCAYVFQLNASHPLLSQKKFASVQESGLVNRF